MIKELTENQKRFCDYYLESSNGADAYMKAYTSCKKDGTARANASRLLANANIIAYLNQRRLQMDEERIAKPEEVLKYFTSVMRGEIKDQFDLDAPLQERTKAATELAKRYRLYDAKDNKSLSEYEIKEKDLELERLRLQNEKLRAEIAKATGADEKEIADDGFITALSGKIPEVWEDEQA